MNNQNQSNFAPQNHQQNTNQVPMQQQGYPQQNQNTGTQVIDKGRIVVAVEQYPEKVNGQVVFVPNTQIPKMKNKWMTVGEATKFQHGDGRISESRKIYLQPVAVLNAFYEEKTFWDSESNQNNNGQGNYRG